MFKSSSEKSYELTMICQYKAAMSKIEGRSVSEARRSERTDFDVNLTLFLGEIFLSSHLKR